MPFSIDLDGARRESPNRIVPVHQRGFEFAARAQHPKVPRGDCHCSPNFVGGRKGTFELPTHEASIYGRVLNVNSKDGMIQKASGLINRKKGLAKGPAHQRDTNGMCFVAAIYGNL